MNYLDVSPMIAALRDSPHDFEIQFGRLSHIRSQHSFRFGPHGVVEVIAACDCTLLAVSSAQGRELAQAYCEWERDYWRPLTINREFASHFSRSPSRQFLISLTGRIHRWLLARPQRDRSAEELVQAR